MKRLYYYISLFWFFIPCIDAVAQARYQNIPDNDYWYKHINKEINKIKLPDLTINNHNTQFRIWYVGGVVTSIIHVSSTATGTITLYTNEYVDTHKEMPTKRVYSKTYTLPQEKILLIRNLIAKNTILQIPTDNLIPKWKQGLDGDEYIFEYADGNTYNLKTYWTPSSQKEVNEAAIILSFADSVNTLINKDLLVKRFSKTIPFESYFGSGSDVVGRVVTWEEHIKYKEERNKYRKSIGLKNKPDKD